MRGKAFCLISVLLLVLNASASSSVTITLDDSGDATLELAQGLNLAVDSASLLVSGDNSNIVSIAGSFTDSATVLQPDYDLQITLQDGSLNVDYELDGETSESGEYDFNLVITDSGNELQIRAEGTMDKRVLEDDFILDPNLIKADIEGFKKDYAGMINEILRYANLTTGDPVVIEEFSISGDQVLTISTTITIDDWKDMISTFALMDILSLEQGSLESCYGMSSENLISLILASNFEIKLNLKGGGGSNSGSLNMDVGPTAASGNQIESVNLGINKIGDENKITGTVGLSDAGGIMGCLLQQELPGDYTTKSLDYTLVKSRGGTAMQSLEADIEGLAKKSGDSWKVEFPAEATSEMDITVKVPSGFSIRSVQGGTQSGNSATSISGEDFTVTYAEGAEDMTMWIIIGAVVLILIVAVAKRKK